MPKRRALIPRKLPQELAQLVPAIESILTSGWSSSPIRPAFVRKRRVRRASGTHRGIALVSPHDTRPARTLVRAGGFHENRFIISVGSCTHHLRRAIVARRTAPGHAGHGGSAHN